jgi:SAM-dependent methyltransferase
MTAPSPEARPRRTEAQQERHYDTLAVSYEQHYSDPYSMQYRRRFFNEPMLAGLELRGRRVLDAMCGAGQLTDYLVTTGAEVWGLDISEAVITSFKGKYPQAFTVRASILDTGLDASSFDCVMVVGGLHHVHPHVDEAIDEIHRILRPGGAFCFMEPHAGSLPDLVRRAWYRLDRRMFETNEEAIDLPALEARNVRRFELVKTTYGGNLAYLLVFNSLVFRVPLAWKRYYAPLCLKLEAGITRVQRPWSSCFVVGQWRKR